MSYENKKPYIDGNRQTIDRLADGAGPYHPEDIVEILEDVASYATKRAADVRKKNENEGVPDRDAN